MFGIRNTIFTPFAEVNPISSNSKISVTEWILQDCIRYSTPAESTPYFMFLLSNSVKDFMFVKWKPTSYCNPLFLQPDIRKGMTKRSLSPKLCFGPDISTSPMPSGMPATAAHCKVLPGCCWASLGSPEQMNWSLNYTHVSDLEDSSYFSLLKPIYIFTTRLLNWYFSPSFLKY